MKHLTIWQWRLRGLYDEVSCWKCLLLSFCTKIHVTRGPCFFFCCAWFSRSIHWSVSFYLWEFQLVPTMNFVHHHFMIHGFSWDIVLMEEILHHLGCIKPCKQWDKVPINWCRIFSINSSETPWTRCFLSLATSLRHIPRLAGLIHSGPCLLVEPWIHEIYSDFGDLGVNSPWNGG